MSYSLTKEDLIVNKWYTLESGEPFLLERLDRDLLYGKIRLGEKNWPWTIWLHLGSGLLR
jgi:hypothetical protein